MERTLTDGTRVLVRAIRPSDKEELQAGLHRLSDETVHKRFMSSKPKLSSAELRYLTEVDGEDHVALVVEEADHPGTIVAVGRWVRWVDEPDAAEFAIVVADYLQRKGLGSLLVDLLAEDALTHGVRRFTASMLSDNVGAQRLMARLTDHLERRAGGGGASELVAHLAA